MIKRNNIVKICIGDFYDKMEELENYIYDVIEDNTFYHYLKQIVDDKDELPENIVVWNSVRFLIVIVTLFSVWWLLEYFFPDDIPPGTPPNEKNNNDNSDDTSSTSSSEREQQRKEALEIWQEFRRSRQNPGRSLLLIINQIVHHTELLANAGFSPDQIDFIFNIFTCLRLVVKAVSFFTGSWWF
nr:hypothetical protein [Cyanidiaceae sp.]